MKKYFLNGILQGLNAVSLVYETIEYPDLKINFHSDRDAMRNDWYKIGADFKNIGAIKAIVSGRKA